ncbi:hypothetical protein Tco_1404956 [Tanacetum coccineum]
MVFRHDTSMEPGNDNIIRIRLNGLETQSVSYTVCGANRLSTIIRRLSQKLFRELLSFIELYFGDIVSRNVLILGIPFAFSYSIVLTLGSLLLGPGAGDID